MRRTTLGKWILCLSGAVIALALVLGISHLLPNTESKDNRDNFSSESQPWPLIGAYAGVQEAPLTAPAQAALREAPSLPSSNEQFVRLETFQAESTLPEIEDIVKNANQEVHIASIPVRKIHTYEVTAYFLNVRTNGYPKSKVIRVARKGEKLDIVSKTDNGWLRISGGGYVHGDYARLLDEAAGKPGEYSAEPKPQGESDKEPETEGKSKEQAPADKLTKPTSTVETSSGLTEEDISVIFRGTALAGHGLEESVLEAEEKFGINALFTIAVMKLESGNGKSRLAQKKNNLFGLNASGSDPHERAYSFETKGDSVMKFGQLLSDKYVDKGYTTIEKIGTKYCPANSKWPGLVKAIMKKDFMKLNAI
jgi:hypothetical protein